MFFSKQKNPGRCLSRCLMIPWFFELFQVFLYKHWPHGTIFRKPREPDAQHQQKHSFRRNRQVCTGHSTRHPSEYILRWVGVLGCMFFLGPNTEPQELFGCLGFWTEFFWWKDLPKQRWTLKGILDPHCWKLLSFGQNLPFKGFSCKGIFQPTKMLVKNICASSHLDKLYYFTDLDLPEIGSFPFGSYLFGWKTRVRSPS